jgi:hypothetical protein
MITKQYKISCYKFWVWVSENAIINTICLKNLIKIYRVTYDSKVYTTSLATAARLVCLTCFFEMNLWGLHVCYPKKMGKFGFV